MATNVKKFKYSLFNKVLCVFLACICFAGSVSLGVYALVCTEYLNTFEGDEITSSTSFTESTKFSNVHYDLIETLYNATDLENVDKLESVLVSKKDDTVNKAYKDFLEWLAKTNPVTQESTESSEAEIQETTMALDELISVFVVDFNNESYNFSISPQAIRESSDYNSLKYKDIIADEYDTFVESEVSSYSQFLVAYYCEPYKDSLNIALKYKNYSVGNGEFSKEKALASPIYIYLADGEFLYGGMSEEKADYIIEDIADKNSSDISLCLYFNEFPDTEKLFFNSRLWNDKYASLEAVHSIALKFNENRVLTIVITALLMLSSFVSGFYYFAISGKKDGEEKASLTFKDKIPVDFHFVLIVAVFALLAYFGINLIESITFLSPLSIIFAAIFAVLGWAVLFEFCSSVARYAHSDRKFAHNFAVVKITKFFIKSTKKTNNRIKNGYRKTVSAITYKPKTMKAYTVALAAGYFVINAFLVMVLAAVRNNGFVFMFFALVLFSFNAMVIYYVTKFIKALDKIIYCAKTGEEFTGNREKLPEILKIILDNMENTKEQLSAAVAKAVKDERLKTELITNVSHDLKTPLTSIISYVDLLSKCDIEDEKAKEYIGVLEEKGSKLKRLIEDLIEASKVTSGNITVNPTSLNLNELCIQAVGENQAEFEKHGLSVVVKESETLPVIFADGAKTFRILENLLSNAKKYSATGSRVYVSTYEEKGMGVFEIKNISAEPLDISPDELTERFVRGDKSRTKEGNGLGLSIAKELCNAQKGKLEISIDGDLFKAKVKLPLADKKPLNDKNVI